MYEMHVWHLSKNTLVRQIMYSWWNGNSQRSKGENVHTIKKLYDHREYTLWDKWGRIIKITVCFGFQIF